MAGVTFENIVVGESFSVEHLYKVVIGFFFLPRSS